MLQSELAAESLESDPDYRAGAEILANTLEESGLEDQTFVRAVGEVRLLCSGGLRCRRRHPTLVCVPSATAALPRKEVKRPFDR